MLEAFRPRSINDIKKFIEKDFMNRKFKKGKTKEEEEEEKLEDRKRKFLQ